MPRPRTPLEKAKATGGTLKNPKRFAARRQPSTAGPIGKPPAWLSARERAAWRAFQRELPWLKVSHRAILEIACTIRARLGEPAPDADASEGNKPPAPVGIQALNLLRQCLGQLGATPADESKLALPQAEDDDDPAASYLQ